MLWLRAVVRATCVCVSGLVCCDYLCIVLMQPSSPDSGTVGWFPGRYVWIVLLWCWD
ncbi:hypothetical protein K466DRAFT_580811 [Polyporus arcularius HHB13444]|uniref:Uncharacterized protein n=1 Tax=Polyporus arcularius HHB13444 TaxID=1314778 RepID=A0A5C3PVS6_9APHY|nr:hypothetical protein K466DRAFT_580811 [Polyporus arcularius HHB13444]